MYSPAPPARRCRVDEQPWNSKNWTTAPNQGADGFKRYVALAALARNVHRLGAVLKERAALELMRQREPYRKAT